MVDFANRWGLSFESFWGGMKMIQVEPSPAQPRQTGSRLVYSYGGYYCLFASFDYCCKGTSSTYRFVASRATNPTGAYSDESGVSKDS